MTIVPYRPPHPLSPFEGEVQHDTLTQADYEALKSVLPRWRDVLLVMVLRGTGLRISEALRLTPEHLEENGPDTAVLVKRGKKRGKALYERVFLHPVVATALRDYIRGARISPGQRIFAIQRRQVGNIFHKAGMEAIGRPVHPHEFRGLYVKTLLDGGVPLAAAAKMVGHEDPKTTAKWYYELTAGQRAEINRRIPV